MERRTAVQGRDAKLREGKRGRKQEESEEEGKRGGKNGHDSIAVLLPTSSSACVSATDACNVTGDCTHFGLLRISCGKSTQLPALFNTFSISADCSLRNSTVPRAV